MLSAQNLLHTLDQHNPAVYLKDTMGRYLSMNAAGSNFMRKTHKSVLGKTAHDLFDFESATQMLESDHYAIQSKSIYSTAFNSKDRSTGQSLHIFTAKSPIISPSGQPLGIIGMSLVNYKNSDLFSQACQILPNFIKHKRSHLLSELLETRTVSDFFKIHYIH